jgi:hypothetical protein
MKFSSHSDDKKDESEDKKDDDDDLTEDIVEQLRLEAKAFFDQMIKDEQGRKKFANWLFKLVLSCLLKKILTIQKKYPLLCVTKNLLIRESEIYFFFRRTLMRTI